MENQVSLTLTVDEVEKLQTSIQYVQSILERVQPISSLSALTEVNSHLSIVIELQNFLDKTKEHYRDDHLRIFNFERFSQIVLERLWDAYEEESYYHRRLVVFLKMMLRKIHATDLELPQLGAIAYSLEMLKRSQLTYDDIIECQKRFRASGVEPLATRSSYGKALVESYINEIDNM